MIAPPKVLMQHPPQDVKGSSGIDIVPRGNIVILLDAQWGQFPNFVIMCC